MDLVDWPMPSYKRQPGRMAIRWLYIKNAVSNESFSADELASFVASNGVSKTKYTTSLGSPLPKATPTNAKRLRSFNSLALREKSARFKISHEESEQESQTCKQI